MKAHDFKYQYHETDNMATYKLGEKEKETFFDFWTNITK